MVRCHCSPSCSSAPDSPHNPSSAEPSTTRDAAALPSLRRSLNRYFRDLDGQAPHAIYGMVMKCVERPMLEVVMKQAAGNQTVAAEMMGISRGTLRRLLVDHELL